MHALDMDLKSKAPTHEFALMFAPCFLVYEGEKRICTLDVAKEVMMEDQETKLNTT